MLLGCILRSQSRHPTAKACFRQPLRAQCSAIQQSTCFAAKPLRALIVVTFCRLVLGLSALVALSRVRSNFLVVALECCEILAGLGELALLHTLTDVPMHESALAVHKIELVGERGPGFGDRSSVGQHADGAVDLGEIAVWHHLWWLVADTDLEASRAPVDELDGALGLEGSDGLLDIDWDDVAAVEEAGSHVLAIAWVAFHHLAVRLEA